MREKLEKLEGVRQSFSGTFVRYGKSYWGCHLKKTLLFENVQDTSGKVVTDHIWFKDNKGFQKLGTIIQGDRVAFDARVRPYVKGYINYREEIDDRELDYKLNNPTKIRFLSTENTPFIF